MKEQLPENAFRELKEGESYEPMMDPRKSYAEVNAWSVTWGVPDLSSFTISDHAPYILFPLTFL